MKFGKRLIRQVVVEHLALKTKVEFKPGGYHVMLIGLKQDLKAGDEIVFTLQFKNSPDITMKAMVKDETG